MITYIYSIITNIYRDERKKGGGSSRKKRKIVNETSLGEDFRINRVIDSKSEKSSVCLKSGRIREVSSLTLKQRVVFKMWMPYLFNYGFQTDEQEFLTENTNRLFSDLQREIKLEMDEALHNNKIYISAAKIASWLKVSRANIDRRLTLVRRNLPWLKELRNELE